MEYSQLLTSGIILQTMTNAGILTSPFKCKQHLYICIQAINFTCIKKQEQHERKKVEDDLRKTATQSIASLSSGCTLAKNEEETGCLMMLWVGSI